MIKSPDLFVKLYKSGVGINLNMGKPEMNNENTTHLEIAESGNFIRIDVSGFKYPNAKLDREKIWLDALITVKMGDFSAKANADLMTSDFKHFKKELARLYKRLDGTASFCSPEQNVEIIMSGDGMGHIKAACTLAAHADVDYRLEVRIEVDQTHIPRMIRQLEKIIKKFPSRGKL